MIVSRFYFDMGILNVTSELVINLVIIFQWDKLIFLGSCPNKLFTLSYIF